MYDPFSVYTKVSEMADRLKFIQPSPVIIVSGARSERSQKVMAGIARAAFNAGAVVIDSGLGTGLEKHCQRKGTTLIGVCPEAEVQYPKLNPTGKTDNDLANGHSHFFTLGKEANSRRSVLKWGQEASFKYELARRISNGRRDLIAKSKLGPPCKYICVVIGDNEQTTLPDIEMAMNHKIPLIVINGSSFAMELTEVLKKANPQPFIPKANKVLVGQTRAQIMDRLRIYTTAIACPDSSEDAASIIHFMLTITL